MADKIQIRRDTAANWTSANPTLAQGEEGHELDTDKRKIGDGTTVWNSLGYIFTGGAYTHPDHSGEVTSTGDGAQVVDKTAISNKTNVTAAVGDSVLIGDASDSDSLKKTTVQSIVDLASGGGGATETFSAVNDTGGTNLNSGWTDIPLITEHIKTSDMVHSASSAEVTVNHTATFMINGFVSSRTSSGTNSSAEARLVVDTGSGFTEVAGTRVNMSSDSVSNDDRNTGAFSIAFAVTSGDKFKLQAQRAVGTGTLITTRSSGLLISINGSQGADGPQGPPGVGAALALDDLTDVIAAAPSVGIAGRFYTYQVNAGGTNYELWEEQEAYVSTLTPILHQGSNYHEYLTLNFTPNIVGEYRLDLSYRWSLNSTQVNFEAHVDFDSGSFILPTHIEPKDAAGTGSVVATSTGGTENTGTDVFATSSGMYIFSSLSAVAHTFVLEFRGEITNQEATVYEAFMHIRRIKS